MSSRNLSLCIYFPKIWVRYCIFASLQGAKCSWSFLEFWQGWQNPQDFVSQNPFQCTAWCPQKWLVLSQLGTAGSSIQEQWEDLPVGQSRIGVWGTSSAWMEGKPARKVGKEDFCLSSDDFSIYLGGALRRDENRMAARKLVRKPAVG